MSKGEGLGDEIRKVCVGCISRAARWKEVGFELLFDEKTLKSYEQRIT